jgi:hypothetical protein
MLEGKDYTIQGSGLPFDFLVSVSFLPKPQKLLRRLIAQPQMTITARVQRPIVYFGVVTGCNWQSLVTAATETSLRTVSGTIKCDFQYVTWPPTCVKISILVMSFSSEIVDRFFILWFLSTISLIISLFEKKCDSVISLIGQ